MTRCLVRWARARDRADDRALLDDAERRRYDGFVASADRHRFVTGRVLVRQTLGTLLGLAPQEVPIARDCRHCGRPHGKPYVPGAAVRFSLSHSGHWVGLAVTPGPGAEPGLDVQEVRHGIFSRLAVRVLTPHEHADVDTGPTEDRDRRFTVLWARKEALLKADGRGLAVPLRSFAVSGPDEPPAVRFAGRLGDRPTALLTPAGPGPGYVAAVAVVGTRAVELAEHPAPP
ncbi:MAG TPA: 4'-phosphopantetheinyl transferase superfamily protein [Kineosporiaceae bacterium]